MMPAVHLQRLADAKAEGTPLKIERDGLTCSLRVAEWQGEEIARSPSRTALALLCRRHGLNLHGIDRIL